MSFLNIQDPAKRDAVVADYLATVRSLQQDNLNKKAQDLAREEDLRKIFNPVVKSTEKSTKAITQELLPLQTEIKNINENLVKHTKEKEKVLQQQQQPAKHDLNIPIARYFKKGNKQDKYFGIERTTDGRYMMGDREVVIDKDSNIHVDTEVYKGTPGLWKLIMLPIPKSKDYTTDDLSRYKDLVKQTGVMFHPRNITNRSRPNTTFKWENILSKFQQSSTPPPLSSSDDDDHGLFYDTTPTHLSSSPYLPSEDEWDRRKDGTGLIQFLPSDIKGLTSRLHLLLAEFAAGNRSSTRNEIVFILDELLRRKKISRAEYTDINSYLSRCL